jgi:hypothetical protein
MHLKLYDAFPIVSAAYPRVHGLPKKSELAFVLKEPGFQPAVELCQSIATLVAGVHGSR